MKKNDISASIIKNNNVVPIFNTIDLARIAKNEVKSTSLHPISFLNTNIVLNKEMFGFEINDKSMYPRFPERTTVVIDPKRSVKNGSFVLIYIKNVDEVYFRLYMEDTKGNREVVPLNKKAYKNFVLTSRDKILGIMVEARWF